LDFDVKVARQLLLWWNSASALTVPSTPATEVGHAYELRFVPWLCQPRDNPSQPLQPWEVIPVTREQARRLTSTPSHLWMELLEPAAVAHIVAKSSELQRVILQRSVHSNPSNSLPVDGGADLLT